MTIVELLVVLAIFAIISGITMVDYSSFKSSASLNNLANDISISIRKAQSYAIGARGNSGSFDDGYGVHFSTDNDSLFTIFTSSDNNTIETLNINSGDKISGFIIGDETGEQVGDLDINFIRPNLDATFSFNGASGNISNIGIILSNQKDSRHKIIKVTSTGQISIEDYEQN